MLYICIYKIDKNMKNFKKLLGDNFIDMSDGVQEFPISVVTVMDNIRLWNDMNQCYKRTANDIDFFIGIGFDFNAGYFKTDGQKYCTNFLAHKDDRCYLVSCICSYTQKEIEGSVKRFANQIDKYILLKSDFNKMFEEHANGSSWQCAIGSSLVSNLKKKTV